MPRLRLGTLAAIVGCLGCDAAAPAAEPPSPPPGEGAAPAVVDAPDPVPPAPPRTAAEQAPEPCALTLGPDRRFPPRVELEFPPGISRLPAVSADGARVAVRIGEPFMDEGTYETPPVDVRVYRFRDFALDRRVILATAEEQEENLEDAMRDKARAARDLFDDGGFRSFRRLRGPVRAGSPDAVVGKLVALEGVCRRDWGIAPGAVLETRLLGGMPAEDDRCVNQVHDVDLHFDPEHGVGLVIVDTGTHADLCASGQATFAFRYAVASK